MSGNRDFRWAAGVALLPIFVILSACTGRFDPPPTATATSPASLTPSPEETVSQATPSPTASNPPQPITPTTGTETTPAPSPRPSGTPTPFPITLEISPSPTPEPFPFAEIQILSPGPLSRVSTPLRLSAVLVPGAGGKVRIELLGEDGRLLTRSITQHTANPDQRVNLTTDLVFEIEAVAETGTLALSVDDAFGRTTGLASVEIILLSAGSSDINPEGDLLAPIVILEPEPGALIEGSELLVTGLARPGTDQPLALELLTREGNVLGSRLAAVEEGPAGEHRPFAAIIPYTVSEPTQVLLIVRERSDRFVGNTQIISQEVILAP